MSNKNVQIFQNICPHNCYSSCGIRTYVNNGAIVDIEGDPNHPFTQGRLCSKGYTLLKKSYNPERILNPMIRAKKGSNQWRNISWKKAIDLIVNKILEIKESGQSTESIFFDMRTGNIGMLQQALANLFNSLGPITKVGNGLCDPAGADAHFYTFGEVRNADPSDMLNSQYIIIWGGNPAATSIHQMTLIKQIKQNGGKIVVIDPIQTATAAYADTHIKIKPGTDGALALGMIKYIYDHDLWDREFVTNHVLGWEEFLHYFETEVSLEWSSKTCGVSIEQISMLAREYCTKKPSAIWQGLGGQRHINGGQNYRIINSLAAITGNITVIGGGIYYIDFRSYNLLNNAFKHVNLNHTDRCININNLNGLMGIPIKLAFITSSNPMAQYPNINMIKKFFDNVEFTVTVDHFFTETAKFSDLILPVATFFEKPDFLASYWHKYIGYSKQAIKPLGESKNEFEIARLLAIELNELGITEPLKYLPDLNADDFLARHLKPLLARLSEVDYSDIIKGGYYKLTGINTTWEDKKFKTPSGKIVLPSNPIYLPERKPKNNYPYRLIATHSEVSLNSQFSNIDVIQNIAESPKVFINNKLALYLKLKNSDKVRLYNNCGEVIMKLEISDSVPEEVIMCYQSNQKDNFSINCLVEPLLTDLGEGSRGFKGVAYHDTFVNISKA
ncbi:MAG: hypothetical protein VR72_12240 [Clostridiaceae bacterium BRH_c20a]|nr:MAG: hypothetical protein VR72_12240 [Clostridiaceae bacterium BRH_c20a]